MVQIRQLWCDNRSGRPEVPGTHDTQGIKTDALIEGAMDAAALAGLEVVPTLTGCRALCSVYVIRV